MIQTPGRGIRALAQLSSRQTSAYVCLQCQRQASHTVAKAKWAPKSRSLPCRYASSSSFSDKLRKRIWGTDNPPGPEDPYGSSGVLEQRRREKAARDEEQGLASNDTAKAPIIEDNVGAIGEGSEENGSEATTWEGMLVVGGPGWGMEEWDQRHPFRGYLANPRPETRDEIVAIIHQALVEVLTLKQAGLPLAMDKDAWDATNNYKHHVSKGARFETSIDGQTRLLFENEELQQVILDYVRIKEPVSDEGMTQVKGIEEEASQEEQELETSESMDSSISTAENVELQSATFDQPDLTTSHSEEQHLNDVEYTASDLMPDDDSWRSVAFTDPEIKFAVLKRVIQLTGKRIADPDIEAIKDARALLVHLVKKSKPKKLVETLFANEAMDLPNVEIRPRRYTPIDKEKEIGRWKVIERELQARGLPVTGKGMVPMGQPIS